MTEDEKDLKTWKNVGPCLLELLKQTMEERDAARSAARAVWMMFSYKEKEARDKGLSEWLRTNCPWLKDE